jgi:hypothetical protein
LDDDATACSPIAPGEGVLAAKYGRVLRRIPAMCFLEGALPEGEEVEVEAGDLSRCSGTTVEVVGQLPLSQVSFCTPRWRAYLAFVTPHAAPCVPTTGSRTNHR